MRKTSVAVLAHAIFVQGPSRGGPFLQAMDVAAPLLAAAAPAPAPAPATGLQAGVTRCTSCSYSGSGVCSCSCASVDVCDSSCTCHLIQLLRRLNLLMLQLLRRRLQRPEPVAVYRFRSFRDERIGRLPALMYRAHVPVPAEEEGPTSLPAPFPQDDLPMH